MQSQTYLFSYLNRCICSIAYSAIDLSHFVSAQRSIKFSLFLRSVVSEVSLVKTQPSMIITYKSSHNMVLLAVCVERTFQRWGL